jgi:hypothetical protein
VGDQPCGLCPPLSAPPARQSTGRGGNPPWPAILSATSARSVDGRPARARCRKWCWRGCGSDPTTRHSDDWRSFGALVDVSEPDWRCGLCGGSGLTQVRAGTFEGELSGFPVGVDPWHPVTCGRRTLRVQYGHQQNIDAARARCELALEFPMKAEATDSGRTWQALRSWRGGKM